VCVCVCVCVCHGFTSSTRLQCDIVCHPAATDSLIKTR